MADKYKEFDQTSIITNDYKEKGVTIRGHFCSIKTIILAAVIALLVLLCVIFIGLLGTRNANASSGPKASQQVGNTPQKPVSTTTAGPTTSSTEPPFDNSLPSNNCGSPLCLKSSGFIHENINKDVDPCTDFYNFACGSYVKNNKLHPDFIWQTPFSKIYNENQEKLVDVMVTSTQRFGSGSYERKLKDFFTSCTDDYGKQKKGGNPFLEKIVPEIGGAYLTDSWDVSKYDFKQMLRIVHSDLWSSVFFTYYVRSDWYDWTKTSIQIDLAGMGMPWTYYVSASPGSEKLRVDYKKFIRTVANLLVEDAKTNMTEMEIKERVDTFVSDAYGIEEKLALLTNSTKATIDPHSEEERVTLKELNAQAPGDIDWVDFFTYTFDQAKVTGDTKVVVLEKDYILNLNGLIKGLGENKLRMVNNYYTWRMAQYFVQELSWEYIHANREYYVDVHGNAQFLGTWRYCLNLVSRNMPQALSALFVRDHFVDENKKKAQEIVTYLKDSLINEIGSSIWMEQSTREAAKKKLQRTNYKLGYPDLGDQKLDMIYDSLDISRTDHFQNMLNFNSFFKEDVNKRLEYGTDTSRWMYQSYDVVAQYYNPWTELIVPAGLLQFPIYDHGLPHYVNFGSIGSIIAHQLIHAVDEYGREYKLDGTWWGNWWTNATSKRYADIKNCVIDAIKDIKQGPFELTTGTVNVPINFQTYSPEAIAENSGLRVAFKAYKNWKKENGDEQHLPGVSYNNDQMFFISYAQANCVNMRQNYAWSQALQGNVFRSTKVNAALQQLEEFQETFQCKKEDAMVAEKKCKMF